MTNFLQSISLGSVANRFRSQRGWFVGLSILAVFAACVYCWDVTAGSRSEYYSAFPVGMSKSLSNFWFGAMDPAGSITLDKIPGSYWIPAIFVWLFGYSAASVILPNALASIALAIVVACTARRLAGNSAGLIAGFLVATAPIVAAVGRSNQPETMFLLALAIATYWAVRALQSTRRSHLIAAGIWIGVAFQCYMIEAWALWPALILAYLFTNLSLVRKVINLFIAGLVSLAVSLVWVVSVALTPASARPFIGGSNTNSGFEMVFGYNAMGRFGGSSTAYRSFTPPFSGGPSFFRLVNSTLVSQIGWLMPVTIVAVFLLLWYKRQRSEFPIDVFLVGFFTVFAIMFSVVAGMHQFYTAALAIPMALILALAVIKFLREPIVLGVLLATAAFTTLYIAFQTPSYLLWVAIVQFVLAVASFTWALIGVSGRSQRWFVPALALGLAVTPAAWAVDAHSYPSSMNPLAGPNGMDAMGAGSGGLVASNLNRGQADGGLGMGQGVSVDQVAYLKANSGKARYDLAVFGAQTAAQYITGYGLSVLPIGGFSGQDPAPTLVQFKKLVTDGELKFVLVGGMGGFGSGQNGADTGTGSAISAWVKANCELADYSGNSGNLYVCTK